MELKDSMKFRIIFFGSLAVMAVVINLTIYNIFYGKKDVAPVQEPVAVETNPASVTREEVKTMNVPKAGVVTFTIRPQLGTGTNSVSSK